jgi:hypothetical protein
LLKRSLLQTVNENVSSHEGFTLANDGKWQQIYTLRYS